MAEEPEWGTYEVKVYLDDESDEAFRFIEESINDAVAALEEKLKAKYPNARVEFE